MFLKAKTLVGGREGENASTVLQYHAAGSLAFYVTEIEVSCCITSFTCN